MPGHPSGVIQADLAWLWWRPSKWTRFRVIGLILQLWFRSAVASTLFSPVSIAVGSLETLE